MLRSSAKRYQDLRWASALSKMTPSRSQMIALITFAIDEKELLLLISLHDTTCFPALLNRRRVVAVIEWWQCTTRTYIFCPHEIWRMPALIGSGVLLLSHN